ncbi:MAG: IS66 family transposase [Methanolinea sp.]
MTENQQNNDTKEIYPASYVQSLLTLIEEQNRIISELREENAQLKARIADLEAQLNQHSRNSNRPPSMDGFRRPKSQRKKGERPPGGQNGHKGHTLDWVETPDQVQVHTVSICEDCGASLEQVEPSKVERRQVHDIAPLKVLVTEHQAEQKTCPCCGRQNRAHFPPEVRYPVQYGQNLKALMVYLCIYQLLPYDRLCETFSDLFGRSMSKATLARAVSECSRNLAGAEEKIRDLLAGAQVLNVDETGMRVNGIREWLHVASTGILTAYGHHRKRGSQAMDDLQILPRFRGTMVHDFWAPYFRYPGSHALCNAHLLRELKGITENYHQNWSEQMYDLILEMKKAVDTAQEQSLPLSQQLISDFEVRYRHIIVTGILENPAPEPVDYFVKRGRKKQSKAKNLLDRCQKYETEILSFMHDFSIPFSNNLAERDIRMMKLQQKISGTFRSEDGADWFCRVRGYISTVKKNELPVFASLLKVFEGEPFIPAAAHRTG